MSNLNHRTNRTLHFTYHRSCHHLWWECSGSCLLKPVDLPPRCDSAAPCPARPAEERSWRSAGSSLSPHPPGAGSAGSSAAGRPAGTGKSLPNSRNVWRGVCVEEGEPVGECASVFESQRYLWRLAVHGPAPFGKLLHVFEYLMFHFERQADKLLRVNVHRVGIVI